MDNSQIVFENGTMLGTVNEMTTSPNAKYQPPPHSLDIPEIVITSSYSCNSLNQSQHRCDIIANCSSNSNVNRISNPSVNVIEEEGIANVDDSAAESTALLEKCQKDDAADEEEGHFEQFILNRTTSESNMLESSIYSELQFPPSIDNGVVSDADKGSRGRYGISTSESGSGGDDDGGIVSNTINPQTSPMGSATPTPTSTGAEVATFGNATNSVVVDMLNTSACSRAESRQSKRMRRKPYKLRNCNNSNTATATAQRTTPVGSNGYLHTTIFVNHSHHHLHPHAHAHHHGATTNPLGQLGNAAPSNPNYLQQLQQPAGMLPQPPLNFVNGLRRSYIFDSSSTVHSILPEDDRVSGVRSNSRLNVFRMIADRIHPRLHISFKKWFSRPSLPFVIGILALGGVACTLGGIVLGSTGLIEHSTHYLSASLLMVGIGVSLLVISGAIWKLSLPDEGSDCPCFRHMEACRSCNSPFCANRLMAANYYYPEFQHRRPPPTYMDSLHQNAAEFFMSPFGQIYRSPFSPGATAAAAAAAGFNRPPPLYRSTVSLNNQVPITAPADTAITANVHVPPIVATQTMVGPPPIFPPPSMAEININGPTLIKEVNYLDLD